MLMCFLEQHLLRAFHSMLHFVELIHKTPKYVVFEMLNIPT